jgi:hypothetical protein
VGVMARSWRWLWASVGVIVAVHMVAIGAQLIPAWYAHWTCGDKLLELVRVYPELRARKAVSGDFLYEILVQGGELEPFVRPQDIVVERRSNITRIRLEYVRPIFVLPSWRINLRFKHDVAT